ncbi:response regulator [Ferrimonas lipolytica]|uniref:Response regulator transcription factor n=1 Tax=Ferrimonas lipolytica TaxID=2724191 RepID=A0A6H1UAT7_9GAMM|nr:response regulator transcription factor [Ferrimonas lipolytica]QIZ75948.1 response regulator transcription factor [Ferrimonas lipolytica]
MQLDKLIIADDHPLFQQALHELLSHHFSQAEALCANSSAELFKLLSQHLDTELVLLDLNLSDSNGLTTLVRLRREFPQLGVIVVSGQEDSATINKTMQMGANGFVPKSQPVEHIIDSIETVLTGQNWLPQGFALTTDSQLSDQLARLDSLSPRQHSILLMFAEGLLNKQIAAQLELSEATVKAHASAIFLKLGVRTRTQAVIAFNQSQHEPGYSIG